MVNVMADRCLGSLVVMILARNPRDWGSIPVEALNFLVRRNPLFIGQAN